jgi:PAS domain S-box-containing protein
VVDSQKNIMHTSLRVLILENAGTDTESILDELRRAGYRPEWKRAINEADYLAHLEEEFDLVLAELDQPPGDGLNALRFLQEKDLDLPFIVVTAHANEEAAVSFMRQGAADYISKDRLEQLGRAVDRALKDRGVRQARRQAEQELRKSEERYRRLVEASPAGIVVHSDGKIDYVNAAATRMVGAEKSEDLVGKSVMEFVHPDYKEAVTRRISMTQQDGRAAPLLAEKFLRMDGEVIDVEVSAIPITYRGRLATQVVIIDNSQRTRAESALKESERQYRRIVEEASDVVYTTDHQGHFTYVNPPSVRMTGYSENDLIGLHFTDLITAQWRRKVQRFYQKQFINRVSKTTLDFPIITRDGNEIWVEQTTTLLTDGERIAGFQSIVRDISDRRRAQEAEKEQRRFAEALAETSAVLNRTLDLDKVLDHILASLVELVPHDVADIMLVVSDDTRIVRSRGYEKFGVSEEAVKTLRLPIADTPNLNQMAETQDPLVIPDIRNYRDWVDAPTSAWIRSYVGAPICVAGVVIGFLNLDSDRADYFTQTHADRLKAFADQAAVAIQNARLFEMTRSHAEELEGHVAERTIELRSANEDLHALGRVKDEFISNVSHELRTPITSIKLYHNLLGLYPNRLEDYLSTLQRETARLENIVEDLLYLSRLDQVTLPFGLEQIEINSLAEELVTDRLALADARGLTLSLEVDPETPTVMADEEQVGKVLSILLTNAFNYTPDGGWVSVSTESRLEEGKSWATMRVSDTGPGIPPSERSGVFKRFYRGKVGRDSGAPGTGLGLAIAQEIVEQHHGKIEVFSEGVPDHGATFTVWLPAHEE